MQPVPSQLGDFRILSVLGHGRTGDVYEAQWGPRRVAVKVVHRAVVDNSPAEVAELKRHAELLRALAHPSLVKVLTVGDLPDGRPYLVMEQLDGRTLDSRLRAHGAVPHDDALRLFGHAAGAVGALHAAGLVHSDIQPKNVFLVGDGSFAVLLGVGVAKPTARTEHRTTTGLMRGTPAWMAPERLFGAPAGVASDIYELGLLLYCTLCAGMPWADAEDHQSRMSPAPLRNMGVAVPRRTERAIMAALAARPEDRPRDVATLLDALGCAPSEPAVSKPRRAPIAVSSILTAMLIIAALAVVVYALLQSKPDASRRSVAAVADAAPAVSDASPPDATVAVDASLADHEARCGRGVGASCRLAGTDYAYGNSVSQDFARGAELLSRGCLVDDARACALLGRLFLHGQGVDESKNRAIELYTKACTLSEARVGCRELGGMYEDGVGLAQDLDQARSLYERGCTAGDGSGCANLGRLYGRGTGVDKDAQRAVALYRQGCELDDPTACYNWAHVLRFAIGVEQDYARAAELYRKACEIGDGAKGCESLGQLHVAGQGVPIDFAKAVELFRRGCDARDGSACKSLATAYQEGRGVEQDYAAARELYEESCGRTKGVEGCNNLGRLYTTGDGGEVDYAAAVPLFKRACDAGVDVGCYNLGLMREQKRGGADKMPEARTAYKRACDMGYELACTKIGRRR